MLDIIINHLIYAAYFKSQQEKRSSVRGRQHIPSLEHDFIQCGLKEGFNAEGSHKKKKKIPTDSQKHTASICTTARQSLGLSAK